MDNGLYLRNTWVAEVDYGLTFRGNDLTKPDQRTASYSSAFTLPDTLAMRDLLAGGEQLDAGGTDRYEQLPAYLVENGEVIFRGAAQLTGFQNGWKIYLIDAVASFFDSIKDKNLSDLDLTRYDHVWNLDHRTAYAGATEGTVYPLIDYGGNEPGSMPFDTMTPALYLKTLFGEIVTQAGYRLTGDWQDTAFFKQLALPFTGDLPKNHTPDYQLERQVRVTVDTKNLIFRNGSGSVFGSVGKIDAVIPLAVTDRPGYQQSPKGNFRIDRYVYIVSENDRIHVEASLQFFGVINYGAPELWFRLEKNGQIVAEKYWSKGGFLDFLDTGETLTMNEHLICDKGDELRLRIVGQTRTQYASYGLHFSMQPGDTWAAFAPDKELVEGQIWPTSLNLPAISQLDLLLGVAKMLCGTYIVDDTRRTVEFSPLQHTTDQRHNAVDWSDRVEESVEPELIPILTGYGQKNYLYWKESQQQTGKRDKVTKLAVGDGIIRCEAPSYPAEATLFELPFTAAADSAMTIQGYGLPPLIKTRILTPGTATTASSVQIQSADPCLILIEPSKVVTVKTKILDSEGNITLVDVTLTACWWGARPAGAVTADNTFTLDFNDRPATGETGLITSHFKPLQQILTLPALFRVSVVLDAIDIATLDLGLPVGLRRVRIGALDVNNFCGYLNELTPYRPGVPCTATLIKL